MTYFDLISFSTAILFSIVFGLIAISMVKQSREWVLSRKIAVYLFLMGIAVAMLSYVLQSYLWNLKGHFGGSASTGKIENGIYFLSEHGNETVVSKRTWEFVQAAEYWFGFRCFVAGGCGMLIAILAGLIGKKLVPKIPDDSS